MAIGSVIKYHMSLAMRQRVLQQTIREFLSGSSLSANRVIGNYRMNKNRAKARMIFCACAG